MITRAQNLTQIILDLVQILYITQGQSRKTNNGVHGRANIMAHIGQKGAFGLTSRFCHMERILSRHTQIVQFFICLLLDFNHFTIAPRLKNTAQGKQE